MTPASGRHLITNEITAASKFVGKPSELVIGDTIEVTYQIADLNAYPISLYGVTSIKKFKP